MGREYAAFSAGQGGGGKGLDKWALQLCRGAVRVGDGDGRVGTALRCVLALLVLMGSLAKGVVMRLSTSITGIPTSTGFTSTGMIIVGMMATKGRRTIRMGGRGLNRFRKPTRTFCCLRWGR
jgi:hypothetical protein